MAAEQAFDIQPPTPNTSAHAAPAAAGAAGGTAAEGTGVAEASSSAGGCEEGSGAGVEVFGPVTQAHLLHSLGIQARLQSLTEVSIVWGAGGGEVCCLSIRSHHGLLHLTLFCRLGGPIGEYERHAPELGQRGSGHSQFCCIAVFIVAS